MALSDKVVFGAIGMMVLGGIIALIWMVCPPVDDEDEPSFFDCFSLTKTV